MEINWNEMAGPARSFADGTACKAYRVPQGYSADRLVNDLLQSSVQIFELEYEEDPEDGTRRISGEGTAEHFLKKLYNDFLGQGKVGVSYTFFCRKNGAEFEVGTADMGLVTLTAADAALEMADILEKQEETR